MLYQSIFTAVGQSMSNRELARALLNKIDEKQVVTPPGENAWLMPFLGTLIAKLKGHEATGRTTHKREGTHSTRSIACMAGYGR